MQLIVSQEVYNGPSYIRMLPVFEGRGEVAYVLNVIQLYTVCSLKCCPYKRGGGRSLYYNHYK